MAMNLRCDNYFVEDEAWHEAADRYADFLEQNKDKKVVLLELGVGFNTPIIIRFPFEKMVRENSSYSLIRLNMDEAVVDVYKRQLFFLIKIPVAIPIVMKL